MKKTSLIGLIIEGALVGIATKIAQDKIYRMIGEATERVFFMPGIAGTCDSPHYRKKYFLKNWLKQTGDLFYDFVERKIPHRYVLEGEERAEKKVRIKGLDLEY
ncbi:hypothetical protein HYW75_00200 [Candidatus Pacearchaeota archaeon]|nr:hypothetical protein [Candidatus Pacearchaeota archaeon]